MVYGCLTCLRVIDSITDAYHLDFISTGGLTLREKILDFIPTLVTDFKSASLCPNCVSAVNAAYAFKYASLESQKKILLFLQDTPEPDQVLFEDIAQSYKSSCPELSDYDVKSEQKSLQPLNTSNEGDSGTLHWQPANNGWEPSADLRNHDDPSKLRWEPSNDSRYHYDPILSWKLPSLLDRGGSNAADATFQPLPATNIEKSEPLKLKCKFCDYSCEEQCMHAFHMILHEDPFPPYRCGRCRDEFDKREALLDHLARHTGEDPYKCEVCFFTTNRHARMLTHQDTHQKPFYCSFCKARFRFEKEMKDHTAEVHRGKLKCPLCTYQSKNEITLQQHKRDHLMCRTCGQMFPNSKEADMHCTQMKHRLKFFGKNK